MDRVDHLVYGTPKLETGIATLEGLLGVRASPGGQHPGRGTHNALISLGPRTYIEIIAPDPEQPTPSAARPFGLDQLSESRIVTWSANAGDLSALVRQAGARGINVGEISPGSRKRPDGLLLTWQYTNPRVVIGDGVVPFFIDWGRSPHPGATSVTGARLRDLRAQHPDPKSVQAMLDHLGLELVVTRGSRPALIALIDSPKGRVELR